MGPPIRSSAVSNPTKKISFLLLADRSGATALAKLASVLPRLSDCRILSVESLLEPPPELSEDSEKKTIFIDSALLTPEQGSPAELWKQHNIILVDGSEEPAQISREWQEQASLFSLRRLPNPELPRLLHLLLSPERCPGVSALSDRGSEIFYEKVQGLSEIGHRVDKIVLHLEKNNPELAGQVFNLRQLSYSILHEAFAASREASRLLPVVDFQCSANPDRFVFSARFKAVPGKVAAWRRAATQEVGQVWKNARQSSDALVLMEIESRGEIEVKALISREGDFSGNTEHTLLTLKIDDFRSGAAVDDAARSSKFRPLELLKAEFKSGSANPEISGPEKQISENSPESASERVALKVKVEVLEKEKLGLQDLVKKKSLLITGLQRDVERVQVDVVNAQSVHNRELQKARAAEEKAKVDLREVSEKLRKLQGESTKSSEGLTLAHTANRTQLPAEEKPNFEKDFKQADYNRRIAEEKIRELTAKVAQQENLLANSREEVRAAVVAANEQRSAAQEAERKIAAKQIGEKNAVELPKAVPESTAQLDSTNAKLKEALSKLFESKSNEQRLEKEVKALAAKVDAAEKNSKVQLVKLQHELELAKRAVEMSKQLKSEAVKKLEEREAAAKVKLEETNENERNMKRKLEALAAEVLELRKKAKAA